MANFEDELLTAARQLLGKKAGQRGRLPQARIRRSISTTYYAVFHFLLEDATMRLIGAHNDLRRRRRVCARVFTHNGMKVALDKVKGATVDASVAEFLSGSGSLRTPFVPPPFARTMAIAFADAQAKRQDADYDLNKPFSEFDARSTYLRVRRAIRAWRDAKTHEDRDFKHALSMLMLLKGRLRSDP